MKVVVRGFGAAFLGTFCAAIVLTIIERRLQQRMEDTEEKEDIIAEFTDQIEEDLDSFRDDWDE